MSEELHETDPMSLMAAGSIKKADRLAQMADAVAADLMMAEGYLVKGEVQEAHKWLVKARYRLAEEVGR